MKRRDFVVSSAWGLAGLLGTRPLPAFRVRPPSSAATRKILIAGGGYGRTFIGYLAQLTGKERPRILYRRPPRPTARAERSRSSRRARG